MSPSNERRRWGRLPPAARVFVRLFAEEREIQATIVNISHSGLLVAADELLPVGTPVRVDFVADDRGVQAAGVVVRHATGDEPPGMALSLRHVQLEDRMSLDLLIERARHAGED